MKRHIYLLGKVKMKTITISKHLRILHTGKSFALMNVMQLYINLLDSIYVNGSILILTGKMI